MLTFVSRFLMRISYHDGNKTNLYFHLKKINFLFCFTSKIVVKKRETKSRTKDANIFFTTLAGCDHHHISTPGSLNSLMLYTLNADLSQNYFRTHLCFNFLLKWNQTVVIAIIMFSDSDQHWVGIKKRSFHNDRKSLWLLQHCQWNLWTKRSPF